MGTPATRVLRISGSGRRLRLESVILLWVVRLALWLLPFRVVRRLVGLVSPTEPTGTTPTASVDKIARALRTAPRVVPSATCLTRALAAQVMLSRRGHCSELRFGVAKDEEGNFQAHAWVECRGRVVTGDHGALDGFTPLPPLDDAGR